MLTKVTHNNSGNPYIHKGLHLYERTLIKLQSGYFVTLCERKRRKTNFIIKVKAVAPPKMDYISYKCVLGTH
jgi:hypothetical protein